MRVLVFLCSSSKSALELAQKTNNSLKARSFRMNIPNDP